MFLTCYPQVALGNNKMPTFCLNKVETKFLYDHDIPAYFRHGIEIRPGDTVLDVGANIGLFALSLHERYGDEVNIYAFEPVPPIFEVLRLNAERFAPRKLKPFPYGLSRETKSLTFSYFPRLPSWSSAYLDGANIRLAHDRFKDSLLADIEAGQLLPWLRSAPPFLRLAILKIVVRWLTKVKRVSCAVKTLSEVIREQNIHRIDLLKVDVEGSEFDVLMGIEEPDWPKIRQVVLEVEQFSRQAQVFAELLKARGFGRIKLDQLGSAQKVSDIGMIYAFAGT